MRRTASLWGQPPSRLYRFLRLVEAEFPEQQLRIAILGCSDGKFVLPTARRGHHVLAIDVDDIALFGGEKIGSWGLVRMPGLVERLKVEGLENLVRVVHGDFVSYHSDKLYHGVFTSGAVQYSRNLKHRVIKIIAAVQSFVMLGGYLYVDYMLPLEPRHLGRENFPTRRQWQEFFITSRWRVLYNRVLPPLPEKAHVDNPVDHYHHWGHLLAQRRRGFET